MIDSSIAMGYKPVQLENPMNQLAQMMQIRAAQSQYDVGQQGLNEKNKLNSLYTGALNPDGTIDRKKLLSSVASGGLGSRIPDLQKGFLETDEAQGKVDKQKIEMVDLKLKQSRQFLDGITTPEDYIAWHEGNHRDPVLGPELAARGITAGKSRASIMQAMQTPGGFEELLEKSALGLEKFIEQNKPTYQTLDTGDMKTILSMPGLGGAPTTVSSAAINQSPDSIASNATTRRGQNMTDARTRESTAATMSKPFEVTGPDGAPVLVQQNKQGQIVPVTGYSAKSVKDKPMTDAQSKAALFGSRMQAANEVLDSLASTGTTTSIPGARSGFGVGAVLNTVSSAKQQQLNQAKRDFVNAVLRRESGAVISEGEFDNAEKQYFPQVGDSKEVISQKKNNREIAMRGVQAEVPKGQRGVIDEIVGSSLPPDVAVALKKHGAK